jgi:cell division septation protein DedD
MSRPRPAIISPPTESNQNQPGRTPSDAIVLFDGTNVDRWKREGGPRQTDPNVKPSDEPLWVVKNGYMECQPRSGGIGTRDSFGDCQLHIEWATPSMVKGNSQGRGNSGVMLHGIGEVQVLDSYENDTYPDGQASAIYGKYPPLVNASRRPGEWQTYDIIVELAKVDPATKQVIRPARLTVFHNGVLTHIAVEIPEARSSQFSFGLQDHGNPVRYRNIWLRPLKGYDAAGAEVAATKPAVKAEAKPAEAKKPEAKPVAKPEAKPADAKKPDAKPEAKPAAPVKKDAPAAKKDDAKKDDKK